MTDSGDHPNLKNLGQGKQYQRWRTGSLHNEKVRPQILLLFEDEEYKDLQVRWAQNRGSQLSTYCSFNAMPPLSQTQFKSVVSGLTHILDNLQIDSAIMGGVAACLLTNDPARRTEDVDLVIHVDERVIPRIGQIHCTCHRTEYIRPLHRHPICSPSSIQLSLSLNQP